MKIGIYLPYNHCEATYMGLRLAELAAQLNHSTSLLRARHTPSVNGVDAYWDRHVRAWSPQAFRQWLAPLDCVVFMTAKCPSDVGKVKLLARKRIYYVAPWHGWSEDCPPSLFDRIICPNIDTYSVITGLKGRGWPPVHCIPWDAGVPRIHRYQIRDSELLRVYVPVDPYTLDRDAVSIIYVLNRLLQTHRHVRFKLVTFKSVPRHLASTIKDMEKTGKLSWERLPTFQRQLRLLQSNDVSWVPSLRSEAGWFALQSVEAGVPVVAYDVPPVQSFLRQDVNAQLVNCELRFNELGAAEAAPSVGDVLRHLDVVLGHPRVLQNIWQTQENHSVRRSYFHSQWSSLWSGDYDEQDKIARDVGK